MRCKHAFLVKLMKSSQLRLCAAFTMALVFRMIQQCTKINFFINEITLPLCNLRFPVIDPVLKANLVSCQVLFMAQESGLVVIRA